MVGSHPGNMRGHMRVIGTAGHVDHGKSTLIAALTGINPDRLKEEQEREMTIDLGFAWLTTPGGEEIGIVDLVVIGLKSWANDHYPELVGPLVGPATMILTLQNGLGNESCWRSSSALTGSMAGSPTSAPTGGSPVRCIISAPGGSSWGRCILVTEFTPRSWPVSSRRREFPVKPWTTS